MIPDTSFLLDGGTALVVVGDDSPWTLNDWTNGLNHTCDTCGGVGGAWEGGAQGASMVLRCPDCDGTGRHTFDIGIGCDCVMKPLPDCTADTLTVHVIDVLPVRRWGHQPTDTEAWVEQWEDGTFRLVEWDGDTSARYAITLPSAAEPGMWLVRLKVHQ